MLWHKLPSLYSKIKRTKHNHVVLIGRWIKCKRGLRQGCPFSLPVSASGQCPANQDIGIRHPAIDGPCPVLQYADDTLLLVCAEVTDIQRLRKILDNFALATGLKINFSKSTLVPMHVPAPRLSA